MKNSITVYPVDYFCPYDYDSGKLNITENTVSIHHCEASWLKWYQKILLQHKKILVRIFGRIGKIFYYIEKIIFLLLFDYKEIIKILNRNKKR